MQEESTTIKNMKIADAAREMGKSLQFVRVSLQNKIFPFGVAEKLPGSSKFTYYINPIKFYEYINKPLPYKYRDNIETQVITTPKSNLSWSDRKNVK